MLKIELSLLTHTISKIRYQRYQISNPTQPLSCKFHIEPALQSGHMVASYNFNLELSATFQLMSERGQPL